MTTDALYMRHALALAARGLGTTAPNPSVGCVIVANGQVVGRGATRPGGRPHAETEALLEAGARTRGAHTGQTGPCAQALIDAGIARVVSAVEDPDPRVAGKGHDLLRAGGVHVATGVCADEAQRVNAGFFKRVRTSIPWVTLKIAASLDGRTALSNGESKWITGSQARSAGHWLRATHDAILTGIGTVLADDPRLDCRLPGMAQRSPVRFVADTCGRLPGQAKLRHAPPGGQVYVLTEAAAAVEGAASIVVPRAKAGGLVVDAMLRAIGATGVTRLLVEAGPGLTTAFVRAGAADEVVWFRSGKVLGGDARAAIGALGLNDLVEAPDYARVAQSRWGEDVMETYARRP